MELGALHSCASPHWGSAPREVLEGVMAALPLRDRCQTVGAVCTWWRQVSVEAAQPCLNLGSVPLFSQRTRSLADFFTQRASFITWLLRRRGTIKRLSLTAERWEDDSQAVVLRLAVAEIVAAQLQTLRLVCTDSGRATSAFLEGGQRLRELQLDFWGRSNSLPRALADCTQLTKLSVQCSSGLDRGYQVLSTLRALKDLSVVDCDWQRVPPELLPLPLTRLHLRFADFADGRWLPAAAGQLASTLEALELPGCQISAVPEELAQLTALTRLSLERNYIRELPAGLARLRRLASLSCEGCSGLRALPAALAAALPLRSLNLLHTGVVRLPLAAGTRRLVCDPCAAAAGGNGAAPADEAAEGKQVAADSAAASSTYLAQLTELRWGVAEWQQAGPGGRRWVGASGALAASDGDAASLPDLSPLHQASRLAVLQLAHVPDTAEAQVTALLQRLPQLRSFVVNSATMIG